MLPDITPAPDISWIVWATDNPADFERMRREGQAKINALFAPHERRERAKQEARWAEEERAERANDGGSCER